MADRHSSEPSFLDLRRSCWRISPSRFSRVPPVRREWKHAGRVGAVDEPTKKARAIQGGDRRAKGGYGSRSHLIERPRILMPKDYPQLGIVKFEARRFLSARGLGRPHLIWTMRGGFNDR